MQEWATVIATELPQIRATLQKDKMGLEDRQTVDRKEYHIYAFS